MITDEQREHLRKIGAKGGKARVPKGASVLSPEERTRRAREAALKRWGKKHETQ